MKIRWTPRAIANLVALRTFIERESDQRVALVVERIMESIELLADQPTIGRAGKLEGTREFVVPRTSYRVVYRIREEVVELISVIHGHRRWSPY